MNRRSLMASMSGLAGLAAMDGAAFAASGAGKGEDKGPILALYSPRSFGAVGDGKTMDTNAINAAIDACTRGGGGMVYLSPGTYLSGTVVLKSNVTLYLEAGAVLLGSTNVADFKPKHFVFARGAENVGIAGPGKIDGQGHTYWTPVPPKGPMTEEKAWSAAIHNEWEPKDRPSPMIEIEDCTNVRIEDVRIENAPGWTMRPFNCNKLVIHGIAIKNPVWGPNTDGIDITGCQDVMVSDCIIDTGDDAICLKSEDTGGMECHNMKNVVVTNCIISGCCNGFKIGTKTERGFENITFSNSILYNDDVPFPSRLNAGISLEMVDGGWVDGVVISNIQMRRARSPINIRRGNRSQKKVYPQAALRGVLIEGIHATDAILTSSITGIVGMELEDISLSDIHIDTAYPGKPEWVKNPVPEEEKAYPQSRMFGWLPSSGLYCRHIKGLKLKDVHFRAPANEWRPTIICDDVVGLGLDGFSTAPVTTGVAPIGLYDVNRAWVKGAAAPSGSKALLEVRGGKTNDVLVTGCDIRKAQKFAEADKDVPAGSVVGQLNIVSPIKG